MTADRPAEDRSPQAASVEALREEIVALLRELRPDAKRLPEVRADARLDRDLGLDSLTRVELLARLEDRFRLSIPERDALAAKTPADLLRALGSARPREAIATATVERLHEPPRALEIPEHAGTLQEVLDWHAGRHAEHVHVSFEGGDADGRSLTYAALRAAALRTAGGLQRLGLAPAEPVALMFPTHPDLLIAFFGVLYAGGVPVPLYPPLRPGDLADYWRRQGGILRNCEARFLIAAEELAAHRRAIGTLTGVLERLLTVAELGAGEPCTAPVTAAADLAMLQYTSGSTGDPKGVMLGHDNLLANLRTMGAYVDLSPDDLFVSWLPLYHDMGLIGAWLGTLYYGLPLVLMPPQAFLLRPERWLWALHRHRATLSAAPNFAYELCVHRIGDEELHGLDLSRWRLALCGAEPVFPQTLDRFAACFASHGLRREALLPVYGLAENTLGLSFPTPGHGMRVLRVAREGFLERGLAEPLSAAGESGLEFVSCGLPLPGHEIRIVDEADRELLDGQEGTVQFRGPSACRGYYRNPEATKGLFHDDWLDTGDLGFIHEGELYLSGRVKDLIIRAGRNIHPQGIEQAVAELPGVRRGRVAVFGSSASGSGTERVVVVAETRLRDDAARDTLRTRINEAIAQLIGEPADDVVLAPPGTVLKTSSGKLRRAACRRAYESGRLGSGARGALLGVVARGLLDTGRRRLRQERAVLYAGYAWTATALHSVPAVLAVALLPGRAARWSALRGVLASLRWATGTPLHVELQAPLPERPCIFVANHASYLDALVLIRALPRPVAFVAKEELGARRPLRWLFERLGVVFVARFDPERCTEVVGEAASAGCDFLFFPEGTFRRMPGLLPFHMGAFVAAAEAGLPVVPVALAGTRSVLRGDERFLRHGPIKVVIGAPLLPSDDAPDAWHQALALSASARQFLLTHCGEPDAADTGFES